MRVLDLVEQLVELDGLEEASLLERTLKAELEEHRDSGGVVVGTGMALTGIRLVCVGPAETQVIVMRADDQALAGPVGAALVTGNTVVMKPSEQTPLTAAE